MKRTGWIKTGTKGAAVDPADGNHCTLPARGLCLSYDIAPYLDTSGSAPTLIADGVSHQGNVTLNKRVYLWNLGAPGSGFDYYTNDPGWMPLATGGTLPTGGRTSNLPGGANLSFQVTSSLYYWDGNGAVNFGPTPASRKICRFIWACRGSGCVTSQASAPGGVFIHQLEAGGGAARASRIRSFSITPWISAIPPSTGIYLFPLQVCWSAAETRAGITRPFRCLEFFPISFDPTAAGQKAMDYLGRNWGVDADGAWSNNANWVGEGNRSLDGKNLVLGVPNGARAKTPHSGAAPQRAADDNAGYGCDAGAHWEFINASSYTITGGHTITLDDPELRVSVNSSGGGSPMVNAAITLNKPLTIANSSGTLTLTGLITGNSQPVTVNVSGGAVVVSGGLAGAASVTKNGPGAWTLTGTPANLELERAARQR